MTAIANETVKVGDVELPKHSDTLNFTVPPVDKIKPSQAEQAGKKYEKTFYFGQVADETEAQAICIAKEWSLVNFVNQELKANARASAYQAESALYKPSDVADEDIVERMVRDFIRMGLSEEKARKRVAAALAED
jgi:hypothetical protein